MKKILLSVALVLIAAANVSAACSSACTKLGTTYSCINEQECVQDAVTNATAGDTIEISAGTATWNAYQLTGDAYIACPVGVDTRWTGICIRKGLSIKGGIGGTTTINFAGAEHDYQGIFLYFPNADSITNNRKFELSNITINAGTVLVAGEGMVNVSQPTSIAAQLDNILIHDMTFTSSYTVDNTAITINGPTYGVAYNNTFIDMYRLIAVEGYNGTSWALGHTSYGTVYSFFFEDNTSTGTGDNESVGGYTAGQGGSLVVRYNSFDKTHHTATQAGDLHGLQSMTTSATSCNSNCDSTEDTCYITSCATEFSQVKSEIYGNIFTGLDQSGGYSDWPNHRGSKLLMFNNTMTGSSTSASKPHPAINEYSCDAAQKPASGYTQHVNDTYTFNNHWKGEEMPATIGMDLCNETTSEKPYTIAENIDFFNYNTSCTASSCSSGVGIGLSTPTGSCTTGVGYWKWANGVTIPSESVGANPAIPISGILYKCTSTDTWESYYTPYTYPHPLRGESEADTTAPTASGCSFSGGVMVR